MRNISSMQELISHTHVLSLREKHRHTTIVYTQYTIYIHILIYIMYLGITEGYLTYFASSMKFEQNKNNETLTNKCKIQ